MITKAIQCLSNRQAYDVLLVDWLMPNMDGLTAAQNLRDCLERAQRQTPRLPILLLANTSSIDQLDDLPGLESIDGILQKPITPRPLYDAIARLAKQSKLKGIEERADQVKGQRIAGIRILVVDDSDINREVAQGILESEGAVVNLAHDGQDALDWLLAPEHMVDLILMDVHMPRMDGYEATSQIRQRPQWSHLPIIALTAGAFSELENAAITAGMNDFIAKPFKIELMMEKVRHWAGRPLLDKSTVMVHSDQPIIDSTIAESIDSLPNIPGIDLAEGLKIWRNAKKFKFYLLRFISQYQNAAHEVLQLLEQGNTDAIARLVHKLKGASFSVALTEIATACMHIEKCLDNQQELEQATAALQTALDQVKISIDIWTADDSATTSVLIDQETRIDNWPLIELLINRLLSSLDEDNPNHAEAILAELDQHLNSYSLNPIKVALSEFDFREAERLVRLLMMPFAH
jgi:CheY-like chemotaxis protein